MAGVEQESQLREGKAPALRDGVTQRWLLPEDSTQSCGSKSRLDERQVALSQTAPLALFRYSGGPC